MISWRKEKDNYGREKFVCDNGYIEYVQLIKCSDGETVFRIEATTKEIFDRQWKEKLFFLGLNNTTSYCNKSVDFFVKREKNITQVFNFIDQISPLPTFLKEEILHTINLNETEKSHSQKNYGVHPEKMFLRFLPQAQSVIVPSKEHKIPNTVFPETIFDLIKIQLQSYNIPPTLKLSHALQQLPKDKLYKNPLGINYKNVEHVLSEKCKQAFRSGKKLLIVIGENHFCKDSLLTELFLLSLAKQLGITRLVTETTKKILSESIQGGELYYKALSNNITSQHVEVFNQIPNLAFILPIAKSIDISLVSSNVRRGSVQDMNKDIVKSVLSDLQPTIIISGALHSYGICNNKELLDHYEILPICKQKSQKN